MKKFLSILLTLSVICSLIVVPAVSVSAAETVLFDEAETVTAFDYSDLSGVSDEDAAAGNISAGGGSTVFSNLNVSGSTASISKTDNSISFGVVHSGSAANGTSTMKILPDSVKNDAAKNVITFKFKPSYVDSNGETAYSANTGAPSYIRFNAISQNDGVNKIQRFFQWQVGTQSTKTDETTGETTTTKSNAYFYRGSGSQGGYSANSFTPTLVDGYYSFKLVSYMDSSGTSYCVAYDMNNNEKTLITYTYSTTSAGVADTLGFGLQIEYYIASGAAQKGHVLTGEFVDMEMTYEYNAVGSVSNSYVNCEYDETTDTYTTSNAVGAGLYTAYTDFKSGTALSTGQVIIDFDIKNEANVKNQSDASGGARKYFATCDGTTLFEVTASTESVIGAFNTENFAYLPSGKISTGAEVTPERNGTKLSAIDGWASIRIVATCSEESGTWSYALYDKNSASGIANPLYIKRTNETTFKGIRGMRYLESGARSACTTGNTSLPKISVFMTFRNLNMYLTDTYGDYTYYRDSSVVYESTTAKTYGGLNTVDDDTVRYDCLIYTQKESGVKAVFAVYDSEGKEVARTIKDLGSGLYEYNINNPLTITVPDSSKIATGKIYVYDGSEWMTDAAGEYKDSRVSFENEAQYGWANEGDALKTLRFYFKPEFSSLLETVEFGAYIIPFVFDGTDFPSEMASGTESIESGEEFGVDLEEIPVWAEDITIMATPFVKIGKEYIFGEKYKVKPINVLVQEQ